MVKNPKNLIVMVMRFDEKYDKYGRVQIVKNDLKITVDKEISLEPYARQIDH